MTERCRSAKDVYGCIL